MTAGAVATDGGGEPEPMSAHAEQAVRDGNLTAALDLLQQQVRSDPSNFKHRVFLFQLLTVLGQWERAMNQLNVAKELDAAAIPMASTYREAIQCESLRAAIFNGRQSPLVFGEPPAWVGRMIEAARLTGLGQHAAAASLRQEALDEAPAISGAVDDQPFEWIADADSRLGPLCEAIVNGRYYWIPFERISRIDIEAPEDLRDVVWTPAHFVWSNGGETVGLIPTRYDGSEHSPDDLIRLARRTDWREADPETFIGLGQRMFTTDAGDYSLMDIRRITLNTATDDAPPDAEDEAHG